MFNILPLTIDEYRELMCAIHAYERQLEDAIRQTEDFRYCEVIKWRLQRLRDVERKVRE